MCEHLVVTLVAAGPQLVAVHDKEESEHASYLDSDPY